MYSCLKLLVIIIGRGGGVLRPLGSGHIFIAVYRLDIVFLLRFVIVLRSLSLLLGIVIRSNRCQPFQCCCTSLSMFLPWLPAFFPFNSNASNLVPAFLVEVLTLGHDHGWSCFSSSCHPLSSSFPCLQSRYCFVCSNHQGCLRPTPLNLQSSASCLIDFDRELLLHIRRINVYLFLFINNGKGFYSIFILYVLLIVVLLFGSNSGIFLTGMIL